MADRVINAIKNVFAGLRNIGRLAVTKLLGGMRQRWQALNEWTGGIPNRIITAISSLSTSMLEQGKAAFQSLWDGAVETFNSFLEWARGIPGRIIEAIGSIDLCSIIDWPEPPQWWTDLFGGGQPDPIQVQPPQRRTMRVLTV